MRRILLNWYYYRPDLTNYLLEMTDEFELIFIFFHSPPKEPEFIGHSIKNVSVIYWGDYKSPYQLLSEVQPDIIVFHDVEAFDQIALNVAAHNKKIPTFVLQHGVRGNYEVQEALTHASRQSISLSNTSAWSLTFFLSAFRLRNLPNLFSICKFIINRKRHELTVALTKSKAKWRNADYYIELSKDNTGYHKMRDGIPDDRFIVIGNPQFDPYFTYLNDNQNKDNDCYALLIDAPFCETVFLKKEPMSREEKNSYLRKINDWCLARGLRLNVKLHPLSYKADYLYQHANIVYYEDTSLNELVKNAALVFFVHFSSLTPLVMHYKPFVFISTPYLPEPGFLKENKIETIDISVFSDDMDIKPLPLLTTEQLESQLYKTDGKAVERLKSIFRAHTKGTPDNEVS